MTFVDDLHCYKDSSESIQDISRHHVYRQEEWYACKHYYKHNLLGRGNNLTDKVLQVNCKLKNTLEKCMINSCCANNSCFNASFLSYYEAEIST